jgi:hypothetical protein
MVKLSRTGLTFFGLVGLVKGVTSGGVGMTLGEGFAGLVSAALATTSRLGTFGLGVAVALAVEGATPCGLVREVTMIDSLSLNDIYSLYH